MSPVLPGGFGVTVRRASTFLLPSVGLLVAGWALVGGVQGPRALQAKLGADVDSDRDGIPDRQEFVHQTDPTLADTDGDGFSDGEEFAFESDPLSSADVPGDVSELSIGLSARGEGGKLMVFAAAHLPDGKIKGKTIRFGSMASGQIVELPFERILPWASVNKTPGLHGGQLLTFDFEVPSLEDLNQRRITYFIVIAESGKTKYAAAAKADLLMKDGVILLRRDVGGPPSPGGLSQGTGTTIHVPIPPDGDVGIPLTWHAEQVCYQTTQVTGITGAVVTHEVVEAYCAEAWQTYCESDCEASVGSTYQSIDTGVLLGG